MARKLSRRSVAQYIAKQLAEGTAKKDLTQQLAAYLIETRRTREVNLIVRDVQFYLAEQGHVAGTLTSARDLGASTIKAIEAFAKEKTGAKTVSLDKNVDEALIGGIKLALPGYELDTTIARQLTTLKTRYRKA